MMPIEFETHPSRYRHWRLAISEGVATLEMAVDETAPLDREPGYELKLNSYDLGVDIELADAIQRIRFEHPEVRSLVFRSALDRVFCSGANIYMLRSASHALKVNFCKFTNETRLYLEELSSESHVPSIAALNGSTSGGGYELALACDHILLLDDGNSAVSLPEVPLLGVLPGTGGLTRLVDKRRVRRDRADFFATTAEGVRGKRALEWEFVDELAPRSCFDNVLAARTKRIVEGLPERGGPGVRLPGLAAKIDGGNLEYRYLEVLLTDDGRVANFSIQGPEDAAPTTPEDLRKKGADAWMLRFFRELDDALLRLRLNQPEVAVVTLRSRGTASRVLEWDAALLELSASDWFAREILLQAKRTLKRLDLTARSFFAVIEEGSCFAGSLLEFVWAADRSYMLDDPKAPTALCLSPLNFGALPMSNGLCRLETRFLGDPDRVKGLEQGERRFDAPAALDAGLVTFAPDDIDWHDELRLAVEERAAFSPDALTGMESNLRFVGPESLETKIFGRLSAWQNWIFQRPNAVGEAGALSRYGSTQRPEFDIGRT
jgi:benzoyl-CoA-dihydrodiol lyase